MTFLLVKRFYYLSTWPCLQMIDSKAMVRPQKLWCEWFHSEISIQYAHDTIRDSEQFKTVPHTDLFIVGCFLSTVMSPESDSLRHWCPRVDKSITVSHLRYLEGGAVKLRYETEILRVVITMYLYRHQRKKVSDPYTRGVIFHTLY